MKAYLVLLLLLPLCTAVLADHQIECYAEDHLMVRNEKIQCSSKVQQACYTRKTGEKGCVRLDFCKRINWTCCYENLCNA